MVRLADPDADGFLPAADSPEETADDDKKNKKNEPDESSDSGGPAPNAASGACWYGRIETTSILDTGNQRGETHARWELALREWIPADTRVVNTQLVWGIYALDYTETWTHPAMHFMNDYYEVNGSLGPSTPGATPSKTYYINRPGGFEVPGGLRDGEYQLVPPLLNARDLGWPERFLVHPLSGVTIQMPPPYAGGISVGLTLPTPLLLEDNRTRMRGNIPLTRVEGAALEVSAIWDLKRAPQCPKRPEQSTTSASSGCAHVRLMIESYSEYLESVGPLAERLGGELADSQTRLTQMMDEMAFYYPRFQQALLLAGIGDASVQILKALGPTRLMAGAPSVGLPAAILSAIEMLDFLQNPIQWTENKVFPGAMAMAQLYQHIQVLGAIFANDYDVSLDYIRDNMESLSGSDNPISRDARKFIDAAKGVSPLLRKVGLQMGEMLQLHGDMQNASLQKELWEEALLECEEENNSD